MSYDDSTDAHLNSKEANYTDQNV